MNSKSTWTLTAVILLTIISTTPLTLCDTRLTTNPSDDWSPSITQTSDGRIWVAWHSHRTGNADLFYSTYDGISWLPDTQLTTDPNSDGLPSIIQANDGKIWVVWTSNRAGNFDLFYKTSLDNGQSWSAETQLTTDPSDDRHPSIVQTNDGKIWVVWESLVSTNNLDLFYKTSADNGQSWSTTTRLTTDTGFDLWPSIMQAQDGAIWVVWQSDRNGQEDIYYKIYDGSSWSPENQLTWYTYSDVMPSIFQAANETIWLVWASDKPTNFDIYYKFIIVDTAIRNVMTSSTIVHQGNSVNIFVEVRNEGTAGVSFDVAAYYNETLIGTQEKTMVPSPLPQQLIFSWNTKRVPYGYYVISVTASTASGETDIADNSFTHDMIVVTIPGDCNGDGTVDILDAAIISAHWYPGPPVGPLGYDANVDTNQDGEIDISDAATMSSNWLESWQS